VITTIVHHPRPGGLWPDGEPAQVRTAAGLLAGIHMRPELAVGPAGSGAPGTKQHAAPAVGPELEAEA